MFYAGNVSSLYWIIPLVVTGKERLITQADKALPELMMSEIYHDFVKHVSVLWISSRPVTKCDPLLCWVIQHDPWSGPMGDRSLNKWKHYWTESMQLLCLELKYKFLLNLGNQEMIWATQFSSMDGRVATHEFELIHSNDVCTLKLVWDWQWLAPYQYV